MDSQVQNESTMQYGHMPLQDRRDPNLDANGSSSFHQNGLGQALGGHLTGGVGGTYSRGAGTDYRNPSTSPPTLTQTGNSGHGGTSSSHSPLTFAVAGGQTSPAMKRKQVDGAMNGQTLKRRRDTNGGDEGDSYDVDGTGQGAKHWTDDEKTRLFTWLMAPGQEEHWNALRATKNSCLRDCAVEVFGGKKTYQALKGCYERNFNLFKQIYAFETAHGQGGGSMNGLSESDRLREYERRLQIARKAGSDVGNITARTIDHWHRLGWYTLFYHRWHGDPATTRPVQGRNVTVGPSNVGANGVEEEEDDPTMDFSDPSTLNGLNGLSHDRQPHYINPQNLRDNPPLSAPPPPPAVPRPGPPPPATAPPDIPAMNLAVTQDLLNRVLHYLNVQTQVAQEKLEYLRRREAREANEMNQREKQEKAAFTKNKTEKAIEMINNPNADAALKSAATDYLRKMFLQD